MTNSVASILFNNEDIFKNIIIPFKEDLEYKEKHIKTMEKMKEELIYEADLRSINIFELFNIFTNIYGDFDSEYDGNHFYNGELSRQRTHHNIIKYNLENLIEIYNKYIKYSDNTNIPSKINENIILVEQIIENPYTYYYLENNFYKKEFISFIIIQFITLYMIK